MTTSQLHFGDIVHYNDDPSTLYYISWINRNESPTPYGLQELHDDTFRRPVFAHEIKKADLNSYVCEITTSVTVSSCNGKSLNGNTLRQDRRLEKGTVWPIKDFFRSTSLARHGTKCVTIKTDDAYLNLPLPKTQIKRKEDLK